MTRSWQSSQSVVPVRRRGVALAATATALALVLGACSSGGGSEESSADQSDASPSGSAQSDDTVASPADLETVVPAKLTIATGEPAFSPWVENDDPASGEGFEAAVAYAVAEKLGYTDEDVVWTRTTFDAAIAPGAKDWDFNLQQFSITDERKQAVDFSTPYYTTSQAVVTLADSPAAEATSLADLEDVSFGVQTGTTSLAILEDSVDLSSDPLLFNSNPDTVQALKGGQVEAIVVDLPTALYLAAAELDNGVVVGQFEDTEGGDEFGLVLPKGSSLTQPVSEAVDALREDGTLADLEQQWLSESVDVPVLQ